MKIVIAPDSFKGTLSAKKVCAIVAAGIKKRCPQADILELPLADGGEGTVDCLIDALHGQRVTVRVSEPLNRTRVEASYGIFDGDKAIMEMSAASGFQLVAPSERDIMHSNTYGTGEMFMDAVSRGCRTIYMGIGGSATNDGGMGFAAALGFRFLASGGREAAPVPANMELIEKIDGSSIPDILKDVKVMIISDVTNPLIGPQGCARIFGPQKGAGAGDVERLEAGMSRYGAMVERLTGQDLRGRAGAGAAGGLGFGLMAFVHGEMRSGIETILGILDFNSIISTADLVITGEGCMDGQSANGKVAGGVAAACKTAGIPCVAIVGDTGPGFEGMYSLGINKILTARQGLMTSEYAMTHSEELLEKAVDMLKI